MLNDEILKALIEGIIYIAPEPVTLDSMVKVLEGEERERVKTKLDELVAEYEQNAHGIQVRQVANGYKFSTKAEHHEILRKYVKSLKAPVRLSKPALETLAVIAYRQPVTVPEIEEIRGVDSGGVIHTLLEKKLVVTSGRKSVVGRPILYRTSKDFLVHFGLKDVGELPSLKEFEELAKRALGSDWAGEAAPAASGEPVSAAGEAGSASTVPPEATAAPSAEAGPAVVEGAPEIPPQPSLGAGEEAPSVENVALPEAAQTTQEAEASTAEETGPASVEAAPETLQEASVPVAAENMPPESSAATEAATTLPEDIAAVGVEAAPEIQQEASPQVSEEPAPSENPAATETTAETTGQVAAVSAEVSGETSPETPLPVVQENALLGDLAAAEKDPVTTEGTRELAVNSPPVPPAEPVPLAVNETTAPTAPSDSPAAEPPADSAEISSTATPETPAEGESKAMPEDHEPQL